MCRCSYSDGNIKLKNVIVEHLAPLIEKLEECGCKIDCESNELTLQAPKKLKATDIKTMPYPGFPTDMQAIFASTLTIAKGTSVVIENIFENRFKYAGELNRMGAKFVIDGRTAVIKGVRKLNGASVMAKDLRGGAALVIAGLSAKGKTKIENTEYILRGYENLDTKLNKLGAKITKEV